MSNRATNGVEFRARKQQHNSVWIIVVVMLVVEVHVIADAYFMSRINRSKK